MLEVEEHRKSALQRPTACWHSIPMTRKAPLVMVLEVLPLVYMHVDVLGGNMVIKHFGFGFTLAVVARSIFLVTVTVMMKDWRPLLEKVVVVV